MKKVIFICLLSISMCLSVPAGEEKPKDPPAASTPPAHGTPPPQTATSAKDQEHNITGNESAITPPSVIVTTPNGTINITVTSTTLAPSSPNDPKETSVKPVPTEKPAPAANNSKKITTTTIAPTGDKPNNASTAEKEGKTNGTTVVVNPSPTPATTLKSRAFDGPSFVGGMILTLGLLAIGFMGFKYYKNQTERNYHTL